MINTRSDEVRTEPASLSVMSSAERTLGMAQGVVYVGLGLWPTLNLRSFARMTGPKPEGWLVKAVGFLLVAIGTSLVRGARSGERKSVATLGAGAGAALGGVAFYYSAKRRIAPIYFLDAAQHLAFVTAWGLVVARRALGARRHGAA